MTWNEVNSLSSHQEGLWSHLPLQPRISSLLNPAHFSQYIIEMSLYPTDVFTTTLVSKELSWLWAFTAPASIPHPQQSLLESGMARTDQKAEAAFSLKGTHWHSWHRGSRQQGELVLPGLEDQTSNTDLSTWARNWKIKLEKQYSQGDREKITISN